MTDPLVTKDLAELLREHQGGVSLRDASRSLGEVLAAVLEHNAAGSLTVKIGLKPSGDDGTSVVVSVDVSASAPRPKPGTTLFYARQGTLLPYEPELRYGDELPEATIAALAVHSASDDEDRRQARSA